MKNGSHLESIEQDTDEHKRPVRAPHTYLEKGKGEGAEPSSLGRLRGRRDGSWNKKEVELGRASS